MYKFLTEILRPSNVEILFENFLRCGHGGMADALGSGPSESNLMEVQVLLPAPKINF